MRHDELPVRCKAGPGRPAAAMPNAPPGQSRRPRRADPRETSQQPGRPRLCSSDRSSVFPDQALDDVGALNPGGHIDRQAGLGRRRSLVSRLVWPMFVVVPRVFGQSPPEVLFTVDQQVVQALAP